MAIPDPKLMTLFAAALECGTDAERAAYLDQACAGNPSLRERVEALVRAHGGAGQFLEPGSAPPAETPALPTAAAGEVVAGRYKLLERVGEGGMGEVWLAEQQEPVRRKVAIKLIKAGMDSRQVIARFEQERQALAMMDHPNIAKVLDGGVSETGRPYFVMELVKGTPITKYCDEKRLTPKDRLDLFIQACHAVQHAHTKGIVHRDLKPSNVLVAPYDGHAVVKVIDFGVAKAAGQPLTEKTLFTGLGAVVGTPEYMSPEQAELNNQDIDTRSDIYSLGVLLYELLTGTTPLTKRRVKEGALLEVLRLIREEEPPRPSTRLSTTEELPSIAATRGTEPKKLNWLVRGELDWIVMKALEKDRNRRYETANGLAMDVQRYLADEPVQACPPSVGYRLRKFARKHQGLLRIAALSVVFLVLAAAVGTWQAIRATIAERRAVAERDRAESSFRRAEASFRMARDAIDRSFTQVSESPNLRARGMEKFRRDLLHTAREFHERFVQEQFNTPGVRYDLGLAHTRLADIDRELGDYPAAEAEAAKGIAILAELVDAQSDAEEYRRDLATGHVALARVYSDTGRWERAEEEYQRALVIQESQAAAHPDAAEYRYALVRTYTASGHTQHRADHPETSATRCRRALDILGKATPGEQATREHQSLLAMTELYLGNACVTKGWYAEAETALKEAVRIYVRLVSDRPDARPGDWQALARSHAILGRVYDQTSRPEKAEEVQHQALAIFEKLAQEHPDILEYVYDLGRCYGELASTADHTGRPDVALARFDKAIDNMETALGKGYVAAQTGVMGARTERLIALVKAGNHVRATDEAEALARREQLNSVNVYNVACVYARSSAVAERDPNLSPAERAKLTARYTDRAMDFLRQAIARGYRNPRAIRKDPDMDPIRAREDFQKLLAELEAQQKEPAIPSTDR